MNHSGNEHLSSESPRAAVLTKDFASNIWYTLCLSSGPTCWRTAGANPSWRKRREKDFGHCLIKFWGINDICSVAPSLHPPPHLWCMCTLTAAMQKYHPERTTSLKKMTDKGRAIFLRLLLFSCLNSIEKAITALLGPTCWYEILIGRYRLKRAIKAK